MTPITYYEDLKERPVISRLSIRQFGPNHKRTLLVADALRDARTQVRLAVRKVDVVDMTDLKEL